MCSVSFLHPNMEELYNQYTVCCIDNVDQLSLILSAAKQMRWVVDIRLYCLSSCSLMQ